MSSEIFKLIRNTIYTYIVDIENTGRTWSDMEISRQICGVLGYQQNENLMVQYGMQNWSFCINALQHLKGKWGGEMDSFYADLQLRVEQYQQNPPDADWTPVRLKTSG